jgi:hypothetical protein
MIDRNEFWAAVGVGRGPACWEQLFQAGDAMKDQLHETCRLAVGKRVRYKGTNGYEGTENHGKPLEGEGICVAYHDSHGLCIEVKNDVGISIYIDPVEVTILGKWRTIDDK